MMNDQFLKGYADAIAMQILSIDDPMTKQIMLSVLIEEPMRVREMRVWKKNK